MENTRMMLDCIRRCQSELDQITGLSRELQRDEQQNAQWARNQGSGWQSGGWQSDRFEPGRYGTGSYGATGYGATGYGATTGAYGTAGRTYGWGYSTSATGQPGGYGAPSTFRHEEHHEHNATAQLRRIQDCAQRVESDLRWLENSLHEAERRYGGFAGGSYASPAGSYAAPSSRRYR